MNPDTDPETTPSASTTITGADLPPGPVTRPVDMYSPITQLAYALEACRRVEGPDQDVKELRLIYKYIVQRYAAGVLPAHNPGTETLSDLLVQFSLACAQSEAQLDFGRKYIQCLRPVFTVRARTFSQLIEGAETGESFSTDYATLVKELDRSLGQIILAERQTCSTILFATNAVHLHGTSVSPSRMVNAIATCGALDSPKDIRNIDFDALKKTSPCAHWAYLVSTKLAERFAGSLSPTQVAPSGADREQARPAAEALAERNARGDAADEIPLQELWQQAYDWVLEDLDKHKPDLAPKGGVDYAMLDAEAIASAREELDAEIDKHLDITQQEAAEAYAMKLLGPDTVQEESAALGRLASLGYSLLRSELAATIKELRETQRAGAKAEQSFATKMLEKHLAQMKDSAEN